MDSPTIILISGTALAFIASVVLFWSGRRFGGTVMAVLSSVFGLILSFRKSKPESIEEHKTQPTTTISFDRTDLTAEKNKVKNHEVETRANLSTVDNLVDNIDARNRASSAKSPTAGDT